MKIEPIDLNDVKWAPRNRISKNSELYAAIRKMEVGKSLKVDLNHPVQLSQALYYVFRKDRCPDYQVTCRALSADRKSWAISKIQRDNVSVTTNPEVKDEQ